MSNTHTSPSLKKRFFISVPQGTTKQRLDMFLTNYELKLSRTYLQQLIKTRLILVNNASVKPHYQVKPGDKIYIQIPEPEPTQILPENIPLDIMFEDRHIIIINKPPGMTVHPASGIYSGTLVNALLYYCRDLSGIGGKLRPGIVHRLDKDTSGLLIIAKHDQVHRELSQRLQTREVIRKYLAVVWGHLPQPQGTIEAPIGRHLINRKRMAVSIVRSREAITYYKVLEPFQVCSLVELKLGTGRTHQIRVHLSYLGCPVVGDAQYGGRTKKLTGLKAEVLGIAKQILMLIPRQALHAYRLEFIHPVTNKYLEFSSPLPEDMQRLLTFLRDKVV